MARFCDRIFCGKGLRFGLPIFPSVGPSLSRVKTAAGKGAVGKGKNKIFCDCLVSKKICALADKPTAAKNARKDSDNDQEKSKPCLCPFFQRE